MSDAASFVVTYGENIKLFIEVCWRIMLRQSDADLRVHGPAGEDRYSLRLACWSGVHTGGALRWSDADPRVHGLAGEDDDCKPCHV